MQSRVSGVANLGEILATAAALCWAVGVILFKKAGERLPPLSLNLFKGVVGIALLTPTIPLAGETLFPAIPASTWALMALSGILGITISDTMFFVSLEKLGAGLTAVVDTSYAPILVGLAFIFLGERMGLADLGGAGLILAGLVIGSVSRPPPGKSRVDLVVGALIGVGGIFVMGVSVIIIKGELDELPMLWSTWVRLAAGTLGIVPIILWRRGRSALIGVLRPASSWRWAVPGAFFGTYLAMACWIGGMKYTDVSRAALLNQLSAIFIFALATVFLREPITLRRVVAVCLALVGAVIVVV